MNIKEIAIKYFKVVDWKAQAEKTKLGDKDYINPIGYDKALAHYRKMMLPGFDGTLASAMQIWPEQFK